MFTSVESCTVSRNFIRYIMKLTDAEKKAEALDEYRTLRGLDENNEQIAESEAYDGIEPQRIEEAIQSHAILI